MTPQERRESRRSRIVVHRARSFQEAEDWHVEDAQHIAFGGLDENLSDSLRDLDFWQQKTPEERLSAFAALKRKVEMSALPLSPFAPESFDET